MNHDESLGETVRAETARLDSLQRIGQGFAEVIHLRLST